MADQLPEAPTVLTVHLPFPLGATVYVRHDPDQVPRMLTAVRVDADRALAFLVSLNTTTSEFLACELSLERDTLKPLT